MGHGDMNPEGMMAASEMLMENGEYFDERLIDAMVLHHKGAISIRGGPGRLRGECQPHNLGPRRADRRRPDE